MAIIYVAHPLAGDILGNKRRTQRWLRWLMAKEPAHSFCCPWLPFLDVGSDKDQAFRDRCLRDDIAIAARCHGIALCGPRISNGMQLELDSVLAAGGWAASFITPIDPFLFVDFHRARREAAIELLRCSADLTQFPKIWTPLAPLTIGQIASLQLESPEDVCDVATTAIQAVARDLGAGEQAADAAEYAYLALEAAQRLEDLS